MWEPKPRLSPAQASKAYITVTGLLLLISLFGLAVALAAM